jgi:N6-adenosine-specific RNA methylase IME4
MPLREIKELPVQDIAAPDCHLFMWTTGPAPAAAFEVIKAWGFKYSGIGFVWIKLNKGEPAFWMTGLIVSAQRHPRAFASEVPGSTG